MLCPAWSEGGAAYWLIADVCENVVLRVLAEEEKETPWLFPPRVLSGPEPAGLRSVTSGMQWEPHPVVTLHF